ncbi:hypothetical protein FDK21_13955 [Cohaesibacter sp. CAU 1516]|uniref:hypothetical protein n=1 Tax=Cohaesibacter sp. CAU 1516 TaxID=2576038 RepID=UPI0010FED8B6|nr:hypothetical protein [Cohaesibacter sp. CAU 1516]TLP44869.1 hypothetical protein FDK21_13955 [Cohaesibacter sp. CAU 1516]
MSRRLKPIKDLSVLILAPRKHDRQLWAELLKNCDIRNPISMTDIKQATITIGAGQVDVVFVDEAYGPQDIANILIPARNVEFAGGRGVCLILCSKKATTQDVLNARKLGFASLVILPASTGTVQKHLELAARYIPMSDEELGWSAPKIQEHRETKAMPAPKDDPAFGSISSPSPIPSGQTHQSLAKSDAFRESQAASLPASQTLAVDGTEEEPPSQSDVLNLSRRDISREPEPSPASQPSDKPASDPDREDALERLKAPGRSGSSAEEEVIFL